MTADTQQKSAFLPQLFTTFCATMGAYTMGIGLGYTSPAVPEIQNSTDTGGLGFDDTESTYFTSVINIGALCGGPLGGLIMNKIGRKWTMIGSCIPFLLSWGLIGFGQDFGTLMTGRVIGGLATGVTTVVVPTYVGEIAAPEYRGLLGSGFQLMVVSGILHAYIFGSFSTWRWLTLAAAVPCAIYLILMIFARETPQYLLTRNKYDEAQISLQKLRGRDDVQDELNTMQASIKQSQETSITMSELKKPWIFKPMLLSFSLMVFQQFTGVNAVLFNLGSIFQDAGGSIDEKYSSIIVGAVQVVATIAAALLMDKAGRRNLLIFSAVFMAISLTTLGVYFNLDRTGKDVDSLGWLPLVSLMVFITAFSLGYGPIPWVMMGELFDPSVRDFAGGLAAASNWITSFVVTSVYEPLKNGIDGDEVNEENGIHDDGVYWLFAGLCALNAVYCFFVIYETKGKTMEEILAHYGAPTAHTKDDKQEDEGISNPAYLGE